MVKGAFAAGDRLVVRAAVCTVLQTGRFSECEALRLHPCAPPDTPFGTLLVPFDRPRRIDVPRRPHAVRARRWLHVVRRAGVRHCPFGGLRCAARAHVDLLPYQLEPALATLRHGSLRVLLADAVGLGKTIQAGLVLSEVLECNAPARALLLMPAGLRHQWQSELAAHFDIDAALCDAAWLRQRTRELPPDANPWALPGTYVSSLDFIKRPEVLHSLEELLWDLVVIDEAHMVTAGTDRRAAADAIAARGRRVLLLTGTPHSGDEAQFDALCRLGEGPARTPLTVFRRTRTDVGGAPPRRSALLRVRLSDSERRMHELLDRYASQLWRESRVRGDRRAGLVAIVLRKRALSSAGSLAASVARRIDLLSRIPEPGAAQLALPLGDADDEADDQVCDEVLAAPGLADPARERRWLGTLLQAARAAARGESKIARLCRFLSRVSEPAIVFTEYRDTLGRLQHAIEQRLGPALTLHGGMSAAERRAVQCAFNQRDSLLLATDAAAEGLNLQQRCRLVVHFELPWNPLRLEQRAGRVDRIGQTRRVHEVALVADDTAERIVLAPLARRAAAAMQVTASGGRMLELLSESDVADAVMSGTCDALARVSQVHAGSPDARLATEAVAEASRLCTERVWLTSGADARRDDPPALTVGARRSGEPALILAYTLSLVTPDARVRHSEPLVLRLTLGRPLAGTRTASGARAALQHVLQIAQARVDALIHARFAAIEDDVLPKHRALLAALRDREVAISGFRASASRQLVQAGLFDRRALRDADRRAAAHDRRSEEAAERLNALGAGAAFARSARLDAALLTTSGRS